MKRKALNTFLVLIVSLLIISLAASGVIFASSSYRSEDSEHSESSEKVSVLNTKSSSYIAMKVCVQTMNYYQNANLEGNPVPNPKKFGDTVYVSSNDIGKDVVCIYTISAGNYFILGHCKASSLVKKDAEFYAEVPQEWNDEGQISNLVDLRKYIRIFGAKVNCDGDKPILVQYDTVLKLFKAAKEINDTYGYTLCVDKAYIPESQATSESCCDICSHSTGASLMLSILKSGESASEKIPIYEGTSSTAVNKISKLLADYSLLRSGASDCFYDADYASYVSTDHNMSSLTYSVWE